MELLSKEPEITPTQMPMTHGKARHGRLLERMTMPLAGVHDGSTARCRRQRTILEHGQLLGVAGDDEPQVGFELMVRRRSGLSSLNIPAG